MDILIQDLIFKRESCYIITQAFTIQQNSTCKNTSQTVSDFFFYLQVFSQLLNILLCKKIKEKGFQIVLVEYANYII